MKAFLAVVRDIGLLVSRIVLGGVLVMRGWNTWITEGLQAQVNHFVDLGVPQPQLFAWAMVLIELIGGVLLIVGLLTPIAGAMILIGSVLLIIFGQFHNGLWVENGGFEYTIVIAALALIFVCFGGGRVALDMLFKRDDFDADDPLYVDDNAPA